MLSKAKAAVVWQQPNFMQQYDERHHWAGEVVGGGAETEAVVL